MDVVVEQVPELADQARAAWASRRTSRRGPRGPGRPRTGPWRGRASGDGRRRRRRGRRSSGAGGLRRRGCGRRPGPGASGRTTIAPARAARAAEPSVEPSSTTISSKSAWWESRSRRRQRSKSRPPLCTGITTESDGLRGPGLAGPAGTSSMIHPRPSERTRAGMRPRPWDRPSTRLRRTATERGDDRRGLVERPRSGRAVARGRDVRRDSSRNPPGCQRGPGGPQARRRGPSDGRAPRVSAIRGRRLEQKRRAARRRRRARPVYALVHQRFHEVSRGQAPLDDHLIGSSLDRTRADL